MKKTSQTIIFFGSGPVAAKSLELLAENFTIEGVVTKPKPAHHHGSFPVLDVASSLGLAVHTVSTKGELSQLLANAPFSSKLGVLIDFGIIVGQDVIDYFEMGIINSHFSILPDLRGADPISFAILSGQDITGVSIMLLVEQLDEGPLLGYGEQPLDGHETTPSLTESLIDLSNSLLAHELPRYMDGLTQGVPQDITARKVSYSRKLSKEDGRIDWAKPADQLEREVRAFIDWPKSTTQLAGKEVILTKTHCSLISDDQIKSLSVGAAYITPDNELAVQTRKGLLIIDMLKPVGKKAMSAQEFLRGYGQSLKTNDNFTQQ